MAIRKLEVVLVADGAFTGKTGSTAHQVYETIRTAGQRGMTKNDVLAKNPTFNADSVASMISGLKRMGAVRNLNGAKAANVAAAKQSANVNIADLETQFLGMFEQLLTARAKAQDVALDANEAYQSYSKVKPAWLGRKSATDEGTKNEARNAFRLAAVAALKAIY